MGTRWTKVRKMRQKGLGALGEGAQSEQVPVKVKWPFI